MSVRQFATMWLSCGSWEWPKPVHARSCRSQRYSRGIDESAVPILPSRNLRETLEFYERLGFELRGAPPETYGYLILGRGGVELHFWEAPEVDPLTTDHSCYLRVADADVLYAEWADIGVPSDPKTGSRLMPPCDTDYGMREFALVDRSGNLVRVGSRA